MKSQFTLLIHFFSTCWNSLSYRLNFHMCLFMMTVFSGVKSMFWEKTQQTVPESISQVKFRISVCVTENKVCPQTDKHTMDLECVYKLSIVCLFYTSVSIIISVSINVPYRYTWLTSGFREFQFSLTKNKSGTNSFFCFPFCWLRTDFPQRIVTFFENPQ